MRKIAISLGDINGIGPELALKAHEQVTTLCDPIYCVNEKLMGQVAQRLGTQVPDDFVCSGSKGSVKIKPGKISQKSGKFSYYSFLDAIQMAKKGRVDAITTLPIHKQAWDKAGVDAKGHTDVLRKLFGQNAIMMLGCESMFVALFTEHIPLRQVPKQIKIGRLNAFLQDFHACVQPSKVAVLGLNPHAGDGGVLGDEEKKISKAITKANKKLGKSVFEGPFIPDVAFTPGVREKFTHFVAMYHDQGLAPLKALYFEESINVSLNLPIIRTSVDHGTAFDIAYSGKAKTTSYVNAVSQAVILADRQED